MLSVVLIKCCILSGKSVVLNSDKVMLTLPVISCHLSVVLSGKVSY